MNIEQLHHIFLNCSGICTDTRKLEAGQLFFALKGDNFNGNTFAKKALEQGAAYAIIDEKEYHINQKIILVTDVLNTLQELATYHRNYLNIPIIGLTGSNGKTTTKELIASVLLQKYVVTATKGNLNNHIGVPLTLLQMNKDTQMGIVEMGANHQKEIAALCTIAQPNFGYITNFGKAHLKGFGGIEGVIEGKSELYDHLKKSNGLAFVNTEDHIQLVRTQKMRTFRFMGKNSDCFISFKEANPYVRMTYHRKELKSQIIGAYNASNIAAAIAIGSYFKLSKDQIKKGIESYHPQNNRSQIIKKDNLTIILDAYNANPTSMQAALHNLKSQESANRIVFLGDMFEVGETSELEHQTIAELTKTLGFDQVFLIGAHFYNSCSPNSITRLFPDFDSFKDSFTGIGLEDTVVLIKGSRGMAMERILDLF